MHKRKLKVRKRNRRQRGMMHKKKTQRRIINLRRIRQRGKKKWKEEDVGAGELGILIEYLEVLWTCKATFGLGAAKTHNSH